MPAASMLLLALVLWLIEWLVQPRRSRDLATL
jgi:hypothetical protein